MAFSAILTGVASGEKTALKAWLSQFSYDFPPGHYRLALYYCLGNYLPSSDGFNMVCFSEFDISDDAVLPNFCDLLEQSTDPEAAAAQGLVVIGGGKTANTELMGQFFEKALTGMACQMRVLDAFGHSVYDYIYDGRCFTVLRPVDGTLHAMRYSYLCAMDGELYLSNFPSLARALDTGAIEYGVRDYDPLDDLTAVLDEEALADLLEDTAAKEEQRVYGNITVYRVSGADPDYTAVIGYSTPDGRPEYNFGIESPGRGENVYSCYEGEGDLPVYAFPMGGSAVRRGV